MEEKQWGEAGSVRNYLCWLDHHRPVSFFRRGIQQLLHTHMDHVNEITLSCVSCHNFCAYSNKNLHPVIANFEWLESLLLSATFL